MGGSLTGLELRVFRVLRVVKLIDLQRLLSPDNYKRLFNRQPQHFIRSQDRTFANAACLPVIRRIVGNAPRSQLL